jgi:hypothetical protein
LPDARLRRPRDIAADDRDTMAVGEREQSSHDGVNETHLHVVGQYKRKQRGARRRTHRSEVAEVDGERPVPNRVRRHKPPIEMNAFNLCVGGQHVERAALGPNHCRIIAWTAEDPRRRGEARGDARDERVLADL